MYQTPQTNNLQRTK